MLTKILFTALVIAAVVVVARVRANAGSRALTARKASLETAETAGDGSVKRRSIAVAVAIGLVLSAALFFWNFWRGWHEVVSIRVINTESSQTTTYQAYRGSIEERSFKTTDGWRVNVSNVERVEIGVGN